MELEQEKITPRIEQPSRLAEIERHVTLMIQMLYDTTYSTKELDEHVFKYCSEQITFQDPWQTPKGLPNYRGQFNGLRNLKIKFEFDRKQIGFQWNNSGGRAMAEGIFTTTVWFPFLRFPLRVISIHDFVLTNETDKGFIVYNHEELWSFAEMILEIPLVGRCYNAFRWFAARVFARLFGLFA